MNDSKKSLIIKIKRELNIGLFKAFPKSLFIFSIELHLYTSSTGVRMYNTISPMIFDLHKP